MDVQRILQEIQGEMNDDVAFLHAIGHFLENNNFQLPMECDDRMDIDYAGVSLQQVGIVEWEEDEDDDDRMEELAEQLVTDTWLLKHKVLGVLAAIAPEHWDGEDLNKVTWTANPEHAKQFHITFPISPQLEWVPIGTTE